MITNQTSAFLQDLQNYQEFPDLVFDFFGMMSRYLKHCKLLFFKNQHLETLLTLWTRGIGLDKKEPVKTHSGFFISLISTLKEDVQKIQNLDESQILNVGVHPNEIVT